MQKPVPRAGYNGGCAGGMLAMLCPPSVWSLTMPRDGLPLVSETTLLASIPGSPRSGADPRTRPGAAAGPSRPHSSSAGAGSSVNLDAENFYQLLGVPYTATPAEINRAYRAAMKRVHPDRQVFERRGPAEEHAKKLNHAYATLSKPLKRQAYDRTIRTEALQDQLMSRYAGGFATPQAGGTDPFNRSLRRERTDAQRRDQARAGRSALISVVVVFGGMTLAIILLLLFWSAARALMDGIF